MRPSFVRYTALAVLAAGVAAIVWTAWLGDDEGPDSAADPSTAVNAADAAYAITLATGRYDDLVGELYRIATNA